MLAVWATATEITAIIRWATEITDIIRWTSAFFFPSWIFFHPEHKSKVQRCRDAHRYSLITNLSTEMLIGIALFRKNQIISNLIEGCWQYLASAQMAQGGCVRIFLMACSSCFVPQAKSQARSRPPPPTSSSPPPALLVAEISRRMTTQLNPPALSSCFGPARF